MRRWTRKTWHYLTAGATAARRPRDRRARLQLEYLEDRTVLSAANFSGTLTGAAFLDANANGTRDAGELAMPGVKVTLTGTLASTDTISAASWANGVVTVTTLAATDLQVGSTVNISGMTPAAYNGTFTVTAVPTSTTFTYALTSNPNTATAFGTASVFDTAASTITAASWANGVVTMTTAAANGLQVGSTVTISGMTPAAYNGTFTVKKVLSPTSFTYAHATNPGTATAFGTARITATTTTNRTGDYTFNNVLPGTYTVTASPVKGLIDATTPTPSVASIHLAGDQTLTNDLPFTGKLSASAITLQLFTTQTTTVGHAFGPVSRTPDLVNSRTDNLPTVSTAIAAQSVNLNAGPTQIDLAGHFTDPDYTDSIVTFNITDGKTPMKLQVELFDAQDPQTVANFFDYIDSGAYDNTIFHRLVTSGIDILQGGAVGLTPNGTTQSVTLTDATANTTKFTLTFSGKTTTAIAYTGNTTTDAQAVQNALAALANIGAGNVTVTEATAGVFTVVFGGTLANSAQPKLAGHISTSPGTITTSIVTALNTIPILSPGSTGVPSEFPTATSPPKQNVAGTIAMALSGSPSDPNSGTDQFFFNVGNNSSSLDSQKFTTFGQILSISTPTLTTLGKTPTKNVTNSTLTADFPTADFQNIPLRGYNGSSTTFPGDATPSNFVRINSVTVAKRDESLTYSVVSNSNPTLVTPTVTNEWLTLNYATGQSGTATIVVKATDRFGASVMQSFTVTVGGPTITGVALSENDPTDTNVTSLTANPTSSDPTAGATVSYAYQWLHNGQTITGATNQTLTLSSVPNLAAGDTLSVEVTPTDSSSITGAEFTSPAVTVATVNPFTLNVPTVSSVTIAADDPTKATTLTATPTSPTDPLGKTITYTYQWLHNGANIPGATGQTLALTTLTVNQGDTFAVQVTPGDGVLTGPAFTSGQVGVSATNPTQIVQPPTISSVALTPTNPLPTGTVTANVNASDSQNQPLTYTYVWTDDTTGTTLQTTTASPSASDTLNLATVVVNPGDTITVSVTVNNGVLNSAAAQSSVQLTGPVVTNVAFTTDDPTDTSVTTLTAQPSANDVSGETVSYTYQWLLNGSPIGGAINQSLSLSSVDPAPGAILSVTVTPTDSASVTGQPYTSKGVTVTSDSPFTLGMPTVSSVAIAADNPTDATKLTATPTSPADPLGQGIGYSYQWLQNGQPIAGATSQTLLLSSVTVAQNDTFAVEVTPSDGVLTGPMFTSGQVGVSAINPTQIVQPPTISSVTLTPNPPSATDILTANVTASDPQGRSLSYTYVWTDTTTNTTLQTTTASASTSDTLDLSTKTVASSDTISVTVTVNNGVLDSTPSSQSVQVA